jgi:mRNA-degrading endonuclease RelE of RelBE toxin-antitoxin system
VKIFSEITNLPEFDKDFKKLSKRFGTLKEDLKIFINTQLNLYHKQGIDNKGVLPISGLRIAVPKIYKAKKFACRALKGRGVDSGIRIIYAYWDDKDRIEFIEIYFKGDKENEDRQRILNYYKK